jgi:hypothetical protein
MQCKASGEKAFCRRHRSHPLKIAEGGAAFSEFGRGRSIPDLGQPPSEPISPCESQLRYNPPMQGIPWSTIALGSLLLSGPLNRRTGSEISAT